MGHLVDNKRKDEHLARDAANQKADRVIGCHGEEHPDEKIVIHWSRARAPDHGRGHRSRASASRGGRRHGQRQRDAACQRFVRCLGPHEVKGLIAHNPGSRQISWNSIRTRDGSVITARPNTVSGRCQNGYTCLFWDTNFDGDQLTKGPYNDCYFYDLRSDFGSNGRTWANEASSIDNPNPRPGSALLEHGGKVMYTLGAGHYLRDLTKDKASNGHSMNDYIDFLWTC